MISTRTGSAGGYRRTKSPNGTGARYREEFGPASVAGLHRWLGAEVKAGRMTPGDRQRRIMLGR